jgi:hypothetical protein
LSEAIMQMRRYLWLTVMLLAAAACDGGSGSSGFDIRSENAAITLALTQQQCVPHAGLLICPADETGNVPGHVATPTPTVSAAPAKTATRGPSPAATPTGTPAAPPAPRIDTGVSKATAVPCVQAAPDAACTFTLPFAPEGFAAGAVYRVAVRVDASGPWTIGPELSSGASPAASFDAPVSVATSTFVPAGGTSVQLAVLVFLKPGGAVPTVVDALADTGADYAFVTTELMLQPQA